MKTYFILFLLAAVSLESCSKFLNEDPKGQIVGDNAINDVNGLDAALTGAYKGIARTWKEGFLNSSTQAFSMGGDDLTTITGGNKADLRAFDQFDVTSANPHLGYIWNGCYKTIQGANNVIANSGKVTGDQSMITEITGEAYFLRGFSYYWLTRGFGNVPLITQVADAITPELLNIEKSDPKTIYALIEADLQQAETMLADNKRDPGRPNKGSAKALLADVYLTEAGWPIKDASKLSLAAAKAKEVIDNKAAYSFDLVDLNQLWAGNETAIGTKEEVFALHTNENYGGSNNAFTGAATIPNEEGGWEDYESEINFFNNYPEGKRKDITFHTIFTKGDGTQVPWQNSVSGHPYYGKFRIADNTHYFSSMPVHMMRYAHVLLIYAEAQARADGTPSADAYTAINAVRERAGLADLSNMSANDFIDAVVNERAWEFAGEGTTRWFDLLRLEKVEEVNTNKSPADLQPIGTITKDDYWFPVPLTDASINPNL